MGFLDELRMSNIFQPGALSSMFPLPPPPEKQKPIEQLSPVASNMTSYGDTNMQASQPLQRVAAQAAEQPQMNTVYDPYMTEFQRQSLRLEEKRIDQSGRFGEERLGLEGQRVALAQLKNEQIYETRIAENQRKIDDADNRLKLAYDQLKNKQEDAEATQIFKQAQLDAVNARHELEMTKRDQLLEEQKRFHDAQIQDMQAKVDQASGSTVNTVVNPEGTERTTTTLRGSNLPPVGPQSSTSPSAPGYSPLSAPGMANQPPGTIPMKGPDGNIWFIPESKVNEAVNAPNNMLFVDPKTGKVK